MLDESAVRIVKKRDVTWNSPEVSSTIGEVGGQ